MSNHATTHELPAGTAPVADNLATVQAIYAAFGRGDVPAILDHMADDVHWEQWDDNTAQRAGVPWLQPQRGKAGVLAFFQVMATVTLRDFRVLSLMVGPNQVAAEFEIEYDVPNTGGHVRDQEVHLWTFDEQGKVTRLRHYTDTAKHMQAARLLGPQDAGLDEVA